MKRQPIPDCPMPDAPLGRAVQHPVKVMAYYGTFNHRRGVVTKDAAGQYWCDGKNFSTLADALTYSGDHHDLL